MRKQDLSRRAALRSSLIWAGAAVIATRMPRASGFTLPNQRPRMGIVGSGSRWYYRVADTGQVHGTATEMVKFGDYVAVCDADSRRMSQAAALVESWTGSKPEQEIDYRRLIDRDDIDIIHISTPDHWHAKIAVEAMLAGKDVYCEKPMTLTIDEGKLICDIARRTGRVVQVGTQQRSDERFLQAIALIQAGRIGELKKAICGLNGGPTSPKLPVVQPPRELDWDRWLGPAAASDYRYLPGDNGETQSWSNCHYEFRWWYAFSGGKLTDWGAHHVDIATWALGKQVTGPTDIKPLHIKHPVPLREGYPTDPSQYNTATEFVIEATFEDGKKIEIRHDTDNGILFEGSQGRIFVNRGKLTGAAVDELDTKPLSGDAVERVYKNRRLSTHYENFFHCVVDRAEPISDVFSHHRALTTCHLAGIAARLGRPLRWDPAAEQIIEDPQANAFLSRESRDGYRIDL